ncbi:CueP family metal-binding protein [Pseudogracilibacillus auburnensis]|uniref:CueP family metal-binding protein n=1 Tax=Pseudogracilibacillus auburnensis TaxID=1494959 RepID=UPI001F61AE0B|nr:CueP family metal-binding protein [Pseudogracilibacillus auburnensis]
MKIKLSLFMLLASVLLVACSNDSISQEGYTEDIKELVHEYSVGDIKDETASITSEELIVTNSDKSETIYSLPEDEFFVSIAPYINETHPCTNHSLTGCQGEMVEETFNVFIEDMEGNVVLEDTLKTEANGFIDLWLPRDKTYNITINHNGKKVKAKFSTFEQDGTCITTMQLI